MQPHKPINHFNNPFMKNIMKMLLFCLLTGWSPAMAQNIVQYEYWFDDAFAGRTVVTVPSSNGLNLNTTVSVAALRPGYHRFSYRVKSSDGKWSVPATSFFAKGFNNIVAYEYWFDDDFATRTTTSITPGTTTSSTALINVQTVRPGYHRFSYRLKTNDSNWSVPIVTTFANGYNHMTGYAYWFDDDISTLQYIPVQASLGGNFINQVNVSVLAAGNHKISLLMKDSMGAWSVPLSDSFYHDGSVADVDQLNTTPAVNVYPNPASTQTTISGIAGYTDLSVFDMNGRIVKQMRLNRAMDLVRINLDGLAPGSYRGLVSNEKKAIAFSFLKTH